LKKIRAIGYEAVQLSGLGPIGESNFAMLKGEGLISADARRWEYDPERTATSWSASKLGCNLTAYAGWGGIKFDTPGR
jgi:hypothetical protein